LADLLDENDDFTIDEQIGEIDYMFQTNKSIIEV
jgi:hypothetical protein